MNNPTMKDIAIDYLLISSSYWLIERTTAGISLVQFASARCMAKVVEEIVVEAGEAGRSSPIIATSHSYIELQIDCKDETEAQK